MWRRAALAVAAVPCVITLGCSIAPRATPAEAATPGSAPAQLAIYSVRGPVADATERRTLQALAAEGRPELMKLHLDVLAATGDVNLVRGNAVKLLQDGPQNFAAMRAAIKGAQRLILWQSYIVEDAGLAAEMGALLAARAREGLTVALMPDAVGSFTSSDEFFQSLEAAGVRVCKFNPVNPGERPGHWGLNHRSHRKLLVVDERIAYTGGINISQVYSSGSGSGLGSRGGRRVAPPSPAASAASAASAGGGWRDTQVEVRGPASTHLAQVFGRSWHEQGCPGSLGLGQRGVVVPEQGDRVVKIMASDAREADNRIYQSLLAAVQAARRSIQITMAYFAPGREMVEALEAAARRGVTVELILPGRSDSNLVMQAGRYYYDGLLAAGVKIHEVEATVLHAKTAVVDGVWSSVGSCNLDARSLVANDELNLVVLGDDFGSDMQAAFARDRASARAIDPAKWAHRGLAARAKELWARLFEVWL